jgi:hypothetical protein
VFEMPAPINLQDNEHELDNHSATIAQGVEAGDNYIDNLENIRSELSGQADGASLGTMVGAQLQMTEVEAQYNITAGLPKKASSANQAASQDVKKAAG